MKLLNFLLLSFTLFVFLPSAVLAQTDQIPWWQFQSIDTMKYSRDIAREKLSDPAFDSVIETQVKNIADAGAIHIAIATPYDEEFIPFLTRWVKLARKHNLSVWFRGNWSGWEGWFGYTGIGREEHLQKTKGFIAKHADLFADGDVFTSCPECENGGPGDPRQTGDVAAYRRFLVSEYQVTQDAFKKIKKDVRSNYFSMNGDVASLVMDRSTTTALGGIVTIDHYVASPDQLVSDIKRLSTQSGGKIVLGEFGVPIPDIHGRMTPAQQAAWLKSALEKLVHVPEVLGLNYWTNSGSSTQLWSESGEPNPAVSVLSDFYRPQVISRAIQNALGQPVASASVYYLDRQFTTDSTGVFRVPILPGQVTLKISSPGYLDQGLQVGPSDTQAVIVLVKSNPNLWFRIQLLTYRFLRAIL